MRSDSGDSSGRGHRRVRLTPAPGAHILPTEAPTDSEPGVLGPQQGLCRRENGEGGRCQNSARLGERNPWVFAC